jgi:inner membrane protein
LKKRVGPFSFLLIFTLFFSLAPDLDAIPGTFSGEFGKYHNNGTHSLIACLLVAVIFALALSWRRRAEFMSWFLLVFISYGGHVLLDFLTFGGRGVMLFWPFSLQRYQSSIGLFYGVRWKDGLFSTRHLWTLVTEIIFILVLWLVVYLAESKFYRVTDREKVETP